MRWLGTAVATAALALGATAMPAAANYDLVHAANATTSPGQANDFSQMVIADVGTGIVAGRSDLPQDGLGDVVGIKSDATGGQDPGLYRIL